ncbi:MAG: hypothetical protein GX137_00830 [Thermoplasmatales archaeon]|jgi:hypothetical protein|nr:hypothetical protein [Thermoplasmatales archaeon]
MELVIIGYAYLRPVVYVYHHMNVPVRVLPPTSVCRHQLIRILHHVCLYGFPHFAPKIKNMRSKSLEDAALGAKPRILTRQKHGEVTETDEK